MKELRMKFRWETEFKETEIGEIPREWEVTNLGDNRFFKILPSGIKEFEGFKEYLSTSSVEGSEIVKIEEVITYNKRPSRANMQPVENSVWLARMINSPKFLKANKDLIENKILSTGFLGIQTKAKETCDYLFYYIQTKEFQEYKDAYVTGAVQESLTNESAKDLLVIIPPLSEQSRIATVLSWFDDLIEVKKRQNEILEKTAMAIFKSWFIDFEPFRDGEFVYSEELGKEIPKGWEVRRLYELCKILRGLNFRSNEAVFEYVQGYFPILRANNIKGGFEIDFSDLMFVKEGKINLEKLLKDNDILLIASNGNPELVGNFAVFLNTFTNFTFSFGAFIYLIRVNDYKMFPSVYLSLSDNSFREYVAGAISGTNINNLNLSDLKNFPILIPPSHILQSFHSLVEPLFQKIILNQKQIMTLRKIRDTLLPLLVFGKLRVEEV
jgi:type I restriction enzyme S subunit